MMPTAFLPIRLHMLNFLHAVRRTLRSIKFGGRRSEDRGLKIEHRGSRIEDKRYIGAICRKEKLRSSDII